MQALPAGYIEHIRIAGRYGYIADRAGGLLVENRRPNSAVIGAFPDTAVVDPDVKGIGLLGDSYGANGPTASVWTDATPLEGVKTIRGLSVSLGKDQQ